MAEPTLFEKIIAGDIPGEFLYQDDTCVVLKDINPQAPTHVLIIPRKPIVRLGEAEDADANTIAHLMLVARDMAKKLGIAEGFRVVLNNGKQAGESVPHMHVHLLGGRPMTWPPG